MPENNIELRSEEIEEILGEAPNRIIRWGITIMFSVILILIIGSYFYKSPEIKTSEITITTENPPVSILARSNGKISELFVTDTQVVIENQHLAVIENPANYNDIQSLKILLDSFQVNMFNNDNHKSIDFDKAYILGDLQSYYSYFYKTYEDYKYFFDLDYHGEKINSVNGQMQKYDSYYGKLSDQMRIMRKEYYYEKKQYARDSILFLNEAITPMEFDKSYVRLLGEKCIRNITSCTFKCQCSEITNC